MKKALIIIVSALCIKCFADREYMVIDVSNGISADHFPVSYLSDAPSTGWSDSYKGDKIVLKRINPGSFVEAGTRSVTISRPYYIGIFEVTQKQYKLVTGENPSNWHGDFRPVEVVSWNKIRGANNWPNVKSVSDGSFMGILRKKVGMDGFDLPTEAQWEYACRAGTTSAYNNGGDTVDDLKQVGRYEGNMSDGKGGCSGKFTTVGSYLPNAWGLYDMHGNLWEWCLDYYGSISSEDVIDPVGPLTGSNRVRRGGSWGYGADCATSSYRSAISADDTGDNSFRICCAIPEVEDSYVEYVTVTARANDKTILDCVYKVCSNDPTVDIRVLAFKDGVRSFANVIRPKTFIEGTEVNVGNGIAANVEHKISWKVSEDWDIDLAKIKFEVLTLNAGQLVPMNTIIIPANGSYKAMEVALEPFSQKQLQDALFWVYADGQSDLTLSNGIMKSNGVTLVDEHEVAGPFWRQNMKNLAEYIALKMGWSILSGDNLTYVNNMTRLDILPNLLEQYVYRWIEE